MSKLAMIFLTTAALATAQSPDFRVFRAVLTPANQQGGDNGGGASRSSGTATLRLFAARDTGDSVSTGTADLTIDFNLGSGTSVRAVQIRNAGPGQTGPVGINSNITEQNAVTVAAQGSISRQIPVLAGDPIGIGTLSSLISNPTLHYINVETTNGAYRGQFSPAEEVVFLALMQPGNEVPPVDLNASAIGAFVVTVTRDSARAVTSASTEFDLLYNFPSQVTFTGLHVHSGAAGQNGPVVLDSGLSFTSSAMNGAGRIRRRREVDLANNTALQAISGVLANPRNFYMNIHTTDFPAGAARGQLRATGTVSFPLSLSSTDSANGLGELRIRSLRNEQGYVQAAYVDFLTNFNFPLATSLTGLQINEGLSGEMGPVRFDPGFSASDFPTGASGFGTIFQRTFASGLDIVGALNLLLVSPQRYYLNVLTSANPAGALRAQIGTLLTGPPTINSIANGPLAPPSSGQTPVAPGSIIVLTGSNFTIASSDLQGWSGNNVPTLLNGVEVVMGNTPIPLLSVSPTRIVAQIPINTPEGSQPIEVRFNGNISAAQYVSVSSSAPVVFSYPNGVSALPNADIPAIGPTGPFRGGDTVTLWVSGLGQTTPALTNGRIAGTEAPYTVNQLTATVGGQSAQVISATAAPGLLGLYQVQLRIPNGLRAGSQPVMVQTQNGTISNTATLNVQ